MNIKFSEPFILSLAACVVWTTFFSMFNRRGVRGYRNFGILGSYVCLIIFLIREEVRSVVASWILFAVIGGIGYTLWEVVQRITAKTADKPGIDLGHFIPALLTWPIMIPEAIEYSLAQVGILKAPKKISTPHTEPTGPAATASVREPHQP